MGGGRLDMLDNPTSDNFEADDGDTTCAYRLYQVHGGVRASTRC